VNPAIAGAVLFVEDFVVAFAVVFVGPRFLPPFFVVARDHAAFAAGRDDFVLAEGPRVHMPECAGETAINSCGVALRAIFDDVEAFRLCQFHDGGHFARPSAEVDGDDGFAFRREHFLDRFGGDVAGVAIDVGENDVEAAKNCGAGGGEESAWSDDDLISGLEVEGMQSEFEGDAAVGEGDGVFRAEVAGVFPFKFPTLGAGPVIDLAGAQDAGDGGDFVFIEVRPGRAFVGPWGCGEI